MNTNSLIEAVKEKLGLPSDYALAKFLNIDSTSIGDMRRRGLSDERVLQFAEILEINPGEALAAMRAERAKNPEVKAAWKKVAESMRSALGVFTPALIAVAIVASSSEPAKAAMLSPAADNPGHCILCKINKTYVTMNVVL